MSATETHIFVEYFDDGLVVGLLTGVHERRTALRQRRAHILVLGALHLLAFDLSALIEEITLSPALGLLEDARDGLAPGARSALVHNKG